MTRWEAPLTIVKRILVGRCTYTTIKHCDSGIRKSNLNFGEIWLTSTQPVWSWPADRPFEEFSGKLGEGDGGSCGQYALVLIRYKIIAGELA